MSTCLGFPQSHNLDRAYLVHATQLRHQWETAVFDNILQSRSRMKILHSHKGQQVEPSYAFEQIVSTRLGPVAQHAAGLGDQACPLTGLAALHERRGDKGPVLCQILPRTNMRGSMTSPFSPPILGGKRSGADGLYLRIKKPWKCRCALSDGGQGVLESKLAQRAAGPFPAVLAILCAVVMGTRQQADG